MSENDGPELDLRRPLSSRERQALINQRETGWMRDLQAMAIEAGHHPFLSAGDSEVVEARFFERLRQNVPFERVYSTGDFSALCERLGGLGLSDRAVVVFSPNTALLGAFVSSTTAVLPRLASLAARTGNELGIMSLDAAHGLSVDRTRYNDAGEEASEGLVLVRAWGDFVPSP